MSLHTQTLGAYILNIIQLHFVFTKQGCNLPECIDLLGRKFTVKSILLSSHVTPQLGLQYTVASEPGGRGGRCPPEVCEGDIAPPP